MQNLSDLTPEQKRSLQEQFVASGVLSPTSKAVKAPATVEVDRRKPLASATVKTFMTRHAVRSGRYNGMSGRYALFASFSLHCVILILATDVMQYYLSERKFNKLLAIAMEEVGGSRKTVSMGVRASVRNHRARACSEIQKAVRRFYEQV